MKIKGMHKICSKLIAKKLKRENITIKAKLTLSKRPCKNSVSKSLIIKHQNFYCKKFNILHENYFFFFHKSPGHYKYSKYKTIV